MAMCPGDTTEWDDIQRKFGNLPQLQKEVPQRELDQRLIESADSGGNNFMIFYDHFDIFPSSCLSIKIRSIIYIWLQFSIYQSVYRKAVSVWDASSCVCINCSLTIFDWIQGWFTWMVCTKERFDPLENRTLEELNAAEDDVEEDFLQQYRRRRLADLKAASKSARFGELRQLCRASYVQEVTEASAGGQWVLLLLYTDVSPICFN